MALALIPQWECTVFELSLKLDDDGFSLGNNGYKITHGST